MDQTNWASPLPIGTKGMATHGGKVTKVANSQKSLSHRFTVSKESKSHQCARMRAAAPQSLIMMLKLPDIIVRDVKVRKEPTNTMLFALPTRMQLPRQQISHLTKILEDLQQEKSQMTSAPLSVVQQKLHQNKK